MKKSNSIIIGVVIVIVVVVGGFMIFHKSPVSSSSSKKSTIAAVNDAVLKTMNNATLGQYLANLGGKTLYTFGGDSSGVSNCTGSCLATWPAYVDTGSTTNLPQGVGTIKRTDNGQIQYTYNGMPLYFFAGDSQGQVTGNGVSNFHVATPAASTPSSQSTTKAAASTSTQSSAPAAKASSSSSSSW